MGRGVCLFLVFSKKLVTLKTNCKFKNLGTTCTSSNNIIKIKESIKLLTAVLQTRRLSLSSLCPLLSVLTQHKNGRSDFLFLMLL